MLCVLRDRSRTATRSQLPCSVSRSNLAKLNTQQAEDEGTSFQSSVTASLCWSWERFLISHSVPAAVCCFHRHRRSRFMLRMAWRIQGTWINYPVKVRHSRLQATSSVKLPDRAMGPANLYVPKPSTGSRTIPPTKKQHGTYIWN